jgi:hypothetical protein
MSIQSISVGGVPIYYPESSYVRVRPYYEAGKMEQGYAGVDFDTFQQSTHIEGRRFYLPNHTMQEFYINHKGTVLEKPDLRIEPDLFGNLVIVHSAKAQTPKETIALQKIHEYQLSETKTYDESGKKFILNPDEVKPARNPDDIIVNIMGVIENREDILEFTKKLAQTSGINSIGIFLADGMRPVKTGEGKTEEQPNHVAEITVKSDNEGQSFNFRSATGETCKI